MTEIVDERQRLVARLRDWAANCGSYNVADRGTLRTVAELLSEAANALASPSEGNKKVDEAWTSYADAESALASPSGGNKKGDEPPDRIALASLRHAIDYLPRGEVGGWTKVRADLESLWTELASRPQPPSPEP